MIYANDSNLKTIFSGQSKALVGKVKYVFSVREGLVACVPTMAGGEWRSE